MDIAEFEGKIQAMQKEYNAAAKVTATQTMMEQMASTGATRSRNFKGVYPSPGDPLPDEIRLRRVDNGWMVWISQDYDRIDGACMVFNSFDEMVACLRQNFNLRKGAELVSTQHKREGD